MTETINQSEFARRVGMDRSYINRLCRQGRFEMVGSEIILNSQFAKSMLEKAKSKGTYTRPKPKSPSEESLEAKERAAERAQHELEKIKQQSLNLDIKNRTARGKLRDAKLVDAVFADLLQTAANRFRTVTSVLDEVIAAAMAEGFESRAASEAKMLDVINDVADDIQRQWDEMVKIWESTAVLLGNQEDDEG